MKTQQGISRLQVGDVLMYQGKEHVVWFVNESRAKICPIDAQLTYERREEDNKILFMAGDSASISANSEGEVVRELGRKGLAEFVDQREEQLTKERTAMKKEKSEKKEKNGNGSAGKLGGFQGHSITSVIRAFGAAGWSLAEARAFFKEQKIEVADNTIKIQIRKGANKVEPPAPLGADVLKKMRPKIAKEEPKADKAAKKGKGKDKSAKKGKSKKADEDEPEELEELEDKAEAADEGEEEEAE